MATIKGTPGDDFFQGDQNGVPEDDEMFGLAGSDQMSGLGGDDRMFGGAGNDVLFGDNNGFIGNDRLDGGIGDDKLFGGDGNDSLLGGDGDDRLFGELGRDVLSGEAGSDRFLFGQQGVTDIVYDSGVGKGNRDRIVDFSRADGDQIHVTNIDADVTTDLDQDFAFVGDGPVGKGEIGFFESAGSTIVLGNTDDDPAAEFEIQLDGVGLGLTGGDFVL